MALPYERASAAQFGGFLFAEEPSRASTGIGDYASAAMQRKTWRLCPRSHSLVWYAGKTKKAMSEGKPPKVNIPHNI
jgi:hypothetical protein